MRAARRNKGGRYDSVNGYCCRRNAGTESRRAFCCLHSGTERSRPGLSAGYLRRCCARLPIAHNSSLGGSRWHSGERRKPRAFHERRWTIRVLQLGRDESRGKCPNGTAGLFARYMRGGGRFLQAVDAFNLHRFERSIGRNGKHSAFRQLFGTLCRVSGHHSQPFFESGFRDAREQQQQRLSTGIHP